MSVSTEGVGKHATYRADYYLFRHFLMGMGTFRDSGVSAPGAMKLIFGVNRPFRIRLDGDWLSARTVLTGGGVPHYLNGEGDWQIILWIESDSSLGRLLSERTLKGRPWALQEVPSELSLQEVVQTVGDEPDPPGALQLAETLLRVYGDAGPVPSTWDDEVRSAIDRIESETGTITVRSLAVSTGRGVDSLDADFRRVAGCGLDDYIHRRKWIMYIRLRHEGVVRERALRDSGLPGWAGLKERFVARYGLDLEILESSLPFVRVYLGPADQPVLYL